MLQRYGAHNPRTGAGRHWRHACWSRCSSWPARPLPCRVAPPPRPPPVTPRRPRTSRSCPARRTPAPSPAVRRHAGPARSASTAARPSTSAYRRSYAPGLDLSTGYTGSDSRCQRGQHLRLVPRRHPARGQLHPRDERPGPGAVLPVAERPLAAHRADDVGQPDPEPRPVPRVALLQPRRRGQRGPLQPGPQLPVDHLGRPGRALHAGARRRQRRRRPPPLAAQPVHHHDGFGFDAHRQRDDRDRSDEGRPPQPRLGLVAHRRLLPAHPRAGRPLVALGRQQARRLPPRDRARLPQRAARSARSG